MSGDIVLSAALRNNLLSLQSTQRNIDTTQLRLATGLKVNSALDNPTNFFTAQALNNRAGDLTRLLDGISQSIRTIEEADNAVTGLTGLLEQADSIAQDAQAEVRSAEGFARIRGNVDLSGVSDLTTLSGLAAGGTFDLTVVESDGTSSTQTITIAAGDNVDDVASQINEVASNVETVVRARVTDGGQLAIESLVENATLRIEGTGGDFTTSNDAFAALGLDTITGTESVTGGAPAFGGTSIAGNVITSAQLADTDTDGNYNASQLLTDAANGAGFLAAGETIDSITIDIDGTATVIDNGGAGFAADTDSVQDVIDAINNAGIQVEASFNATTGRIELEFSESAGQTTITYNDAAGGATLGFDFGNSGQTAAALAAGDTVAETITFDGVNPDVDQYEEDFNELRTQIDNLIEDADYRGVGLLTGDDLITYFNESRENTLTTEGQDFSVLGLGIDEADFTNANNVELALDAVRDAIDQVRAFGLSIANDLNVIQTRRDFTESTINTLKAGADDLTVADQNEEGANLLALQTRQQLGVTSLSLAAQSQQSVLRLF